MKVKRVLCGVLAAMLVISLMTCLTGCGGSENETVSGEPYTIDWYHVTSKSITDTTAVEAAVNEYLKGKLNANLKLHYLSWGEYDQKINVMIAGGEKFDICYTSGGSYRLNATKGAYTPLNDLLDKYAPKTKALLGEDFLKGSQVNGINYAIPANKDKGHHNGILYRKDIAEELGLTEQLSQVKTFEDLYPIFEIVKEKRTDVAPFITHGEFGYERMINYDSVAFPAGFLVDKHDGKVINYVETEEYEEACRINRELRLKGYTWQGLKVADEKHFAEFSQLKPGKDAEISAGRDYEYVQIDLTTPMMYSSDTVGSLMAVSLTSKQPETAVQFLELFNTDKYLNNLIVYGIEGVNYEKIDDNTIRPISDSGYGSAGMQWEFGNTMINYVVEGEQPDKAAKMEEYNLNLIPVEMLGFSFDSEAVKTEVGACQNVKSEFSKVLASGDADYEEVLANYRAKLKSAGADRILEEAQKQYNEWLANNK